MFKRRDRLSPWQTFRHMVWPKGGWVRAFEYVKHRLRRLPDTPEKIARGLGAGVFASFTPFFGLHFLIAWLAARLVRGNVPAALIGTFFGNPATYIPIAMTSIWTGHLILGSRPDRGLEYTLQYKIGGAFGDLWFNLIAIFSSEKTDWTHLLIFYDDVFYPFMIGCIIPGLIAATLVYYLSVGVIGAYQKSRRKRLRAKLKQLNAAGSASDRH